MDRRRFSKLLPVLAVTPPLLGLPKKAKDDTITINDVYIASLDRERAYKDFHYYCSFMIRNDMTTPSQSEILWVRMREARLRQGEELRRRLF